MPPDLEALYEPLWQQVASMFTKWLAYVRLFGTNEADLAILNRAAGGFFALVQNIMIGDILLSASRLTDSKGTGQRTNLTLEALVHSIDPAGYPSLRATADAKLADAQSKTEFARAWRNRQIAHLDLRTALGSHANPLTPYSRAEVQCALDAIAEVLNTVAVHFTGMVTAFSDVIDAPGNAQTLINRLRDGLALRDWRMESRARGGTGELPPEV